MKILGTLTVDTPNALDKVTDLNADLLDGKSSELFLSRSSTTGVYIADTAIVIDNSITPTEGGGRLKIYDRDSTDATVKGLSIGALYSATDNVADITTIDADLHISLATDKVFKLFTNATGVSSTNRLTVLANGNVGINKATPTAKLQVHVGATETTLHPLLITAVTKTLFDVDFSGNIGINAAADANVQLLLQGARTSTNGSLIYGIKNDLTYVAPPAAVASIYSMYIGTTIEADTTFATAAALFINEIIITGGASATKYGIYQVGAADSNVFNGITTFSNAFTLSAITNTIDIGGAQTIGVLTLGGTLQTGIITLGRSTVTHTLNIDAGATTSDNTKTINIGTGGVSGSTTNITYGSTIGTTHTFNGNVGIGTGSPSSKLSVKGSDGDTSANAKSNYQITAESIDAYGYIGVGYRQDSGVAEYARIQAYSTYLEGSPRALVLQEFGGNVLIGKTTDDGINKLQVEGGVSVTQLSIYKTGAYDATTHNYLDIFGSFQGTNPTTTSNAGASTGIRMGSIEHGKHAIIEAVSEDFFGYSRLTGLSFKTSNLDADPVEAVRISAGGNVGIGAIPPTEKLHVVGNVLATGTVTGSNIFTQYHWSFTIATTNTSGCTVRSNTENTTLCSSSAFYKRTALNTSLGTTSAVNFSSYLICVYIKAGTNWEIVYPDIVIESGGVVAITFASDQHSNIFKVVMV